MKPIEMLLMVSTAYLPLMNIENIDEHTSQFTTIDYEIPYEPDEIFHHFTNPVNHGTLNLKILEQS